MRVVRYVRFMRGMTTSLGDVLIAATALNVNLTLATHNPIDFSWIKSLAVFDPLQKCFLAHALLLSLLI
jgi:predicted nucleic acid-binding protein